VIGSQNVKPEDGTAAVTAESLSRLASVGLRYGFFIGCLGSVDDWDSKICPTSAASSEDVILASGNRPASCQARQPIYPCACVTA